MECAPIRAQLWLDAHEGDLAGLRVAEAVAVVERAGLLARVVPYAAGRPDEEQQGDRVNLWLAGSGAISAADAG